MHTTESRQSEMKDDPTITRYVDAATALHGLTLTTEQRERVIAIFTMNAALLAPLLDHPLPPELEQAPTFKT